MSLIIGTLSKILLVTTKGAGAVYAISNSSFSSKINSNNLNPASQPSIIIEKLKLESETLSKTKERFCPIMVRDNEKDCEKIILENY